MIRPPSTDSTTFAEALAVLDRRSVIDGVPTSVKERLTAGVRGEVPETPKPGEELFTTVTHVVIGNNALVVDAATRTAEGLGYRTQIVTRGLQGEARDVGRDLVVDGRSLSPPACLAAGGETTVTVRGPGQGGRCQELTLAAALELRPDEDLVVLAAGTDGTDGPTDAAGAVVDAGTVARGRAAGLDPVRSLAENDAYAFLRASGDLVVTGPTNTNLLDLYLVLRPAAHPLGEAV